MKQNLKQKIEFLLQNQGYQVINVAGNSIGDITFSQRKEGYLSVKIMGRLDINGEELKEKKSDPSSLTDTGISTIEGINVPSGDLKVAFIEPLSDVTIDTLNIDLNRMDIKEPFKTAERVGSGGILGNAAAGKLEDNYQDSIRKVLNLLYPKILEKIDIKIDYKVINGYEKDIKDIKSKKRY